MILEMADLRVDPARLEEFDAAIERGVATIIAKAKGFAGYKVIRSLETPGRYVLMINWQTLENHTVDFRESTAFGEWRAIVGPFFTAPSFVEHFALVCKSD